MQKKSNRDQEGRQNYMKKIMFLFIGFIAYCAAVGNSAEPLASSKQATLPNQPPEAVSPTLQAKLGQARAILSEIRDILNQADKSLAGMREQKELAKKNEASLTEYNRVDDLIRQEIQKLRDQVKEAEKDWAVQAKQEERYSRVQAEFAKAEKERIDSESKAQEAETKLAEAQKSLTELKSRFAELMTKSDEAKKQAHGLKDATAVLETERARRAEALTRAEKAVVMAEKAEKERLLLASRLAELERNLPLQRKDSPEQPNIQSEIEKEKKAVQETEEKIRKDEKACEEAEKTIVELKKQLKAREETTRLKSQKESDTKRLQSQIAGMRKQRDEAEEQLGKTEEKLKESEESAAVLTNMIAAAERQQEIDRETVKSIAVLTDEHNKEIALMNEVNARINKQILNLKAFEDENIRLNQNLILVKEKLGRGEQNINKPDEIRLQIAEQKKIRADMETRLQQMALDQDALGKEKEQLNQALIEAGNLILKNEKDFQETGKVADELQKEKELARKSADLLRKKEESVKQLADEKLALQNKLNEAEAKLAQREEQGSAEQTRIKSELESEKRALLETGEKIKKDEKAREEAEKPIAELKKQLRVLETARGGEKEGDPNRLQFRLESLRKQRSEAEERMKKAEGKLQESEQSLTALTNMVADARKAKEINKETISSERAGIERKIENERKALIEVEDKIKKEEKACKESDDTIAELKNQLQALEETTYLGSQKGDNTKRLQIRLEKNRNQRIAAEEQLKKVEEKLKESEESVAVLTNMIAAAERQQEIDRETVKSIAVLTDEHNKEAALMNEVNARINKQILNLKALEDEKIRLNQSLILVKEKLGREEQNVNKLDETRLQIAEQKKIRADMEAKLQQAIRDQDALEKEKGQLNQALIEAGNLILKNEKDFQEAGKVADELQKEKELALKSADLLRKKEESVKQLANDKADLQDKLNEAEAKLARQKEQTKGLEEKRRALEEEKKAKLVSEKQYSELAQTEEEHKKQIKELQGNVRAATGQGESLSSQEEARAAPRRETLIVSQARTSSPQNSTASDSEAKKTQSAASMTENSGKEALTMEQDILNKARSGDLQSSEQDIGVDQHQEKKAIKQAGSRSRQNQLAQAEEHYELGIQKWDEGDLDGAVAEFKKVIRLNPDAAGAYYNISLVCLRQGRKEEACNYAYQAGECYIRIDNLAQAARMAVLLMKIDQNSPLIQKLRNKITAASK